MIKNFVNRLMGKAPASPKTQFGQEKRIPFKDHRIDPSLIDEVNKGIRQKKNNAEFVFQGVAHRFKAALEAAEAVMAGYHNSPDAGVAGGEQGGVGALLAGLAGVQTLADAGFSCPAVLR